MRQKHTIQVETMGLHPRTCQQCGKGFESRSDYAYRKETGHGKSIWFCSHKCIRAFEREALVRNRRGKAPGDDAQKILRLLKRGLSQSQVADELGIRPQRVAEIRDRWLDWEVRKDA